MTSHRRRRRASCRRRRRSSWAVVWVLHLAFQLCSFAVSLTSKPLGVCKSAAFSAYHGLSKRAYTRIGGCLYRLEARQKTCAPPSVLTNFDFYLIPERMQAYLCSHRRYFFLSVICQEWQMGCYVHMGLTAHLVFRGSHLATPNKLVFNL